MRRLDMRPFVRARRLGLAAASLGLALIGSACGGSSDGGGSTGGGGPSQIVMAPTSATLAIGDTITIVGTPETANGATVPGVTLFWSSDSTSVATVTQSGKVTAVGVGTATIAASSNGVSGVTRITVTLKDVATITITPSPVSLTVNQTQQLTATLKDSSGNVLTGRTVVWSSSDSAAATVDQSGFVVARAAGSTTISATSGGAKGTASVTVTNVPVASVTVTPTNPTVFVGATTQLTATLKDANGNVLTGRPVTWASNSGNATVDQTGTVTGVSVGQAQISATSGGVKGTVTITVQNPPASSVVISPSVANLLVGQTVQLSATVTDSNGVPIQGATVTYTSGNTAIATVTTAGLVTAVSQGTALITGKSGTASGAAAITVSLVPVKTITISPSLDSLTSGGQVQLTATAFDSAGNVLTGRTFTWTSGNTSDATVNTTGLVTTSSSTSITSTRSLTIFASIGSTQGTATIVVRPVPIVSVTVSPAADTVQQGSTVQLSTTIVDSLGRTVTRTVTWSTGNSSIASVSGSGLVTGVGPGSTQITATVGTTQGVNTTLVTQTPVTSVKVYLVPDTLVVGSTEVAIDTTTPLGRPVTWSSSNPSIATITATGTITAVAPGVDTITATAGGVTGFEALTVTNVPVTNVTVTLTPDTLAIGAAETAAATTTPSGQSVTWSSSNPSVATISASTGVITAVGLGTTTITATAAGGVKGTEGLTVTLSSVSVTPNPIVDTVGGASHQATATGLDVHGNTVAGVTFTWSTKSNNTIASVNASGVVTGVAAGNDTVYATGGGKTGAAGVSVAPAAPPAVASVVVTPSSSSTFATAPGNSAVVLTGTAYDASNNVISGVTLTWASSNTAVATVVNGTVTPTGNGAATVTITASAPNGVTSSPVSVAVVGHVATDTVTVGATELSVSGTGFPTSTTATASLRDTFGNLLPQSETVTWTSSDPTNAPITPASNPQPLSTPVTITALAANGGNESVTITATSTDGSVVGSVTITLVP